MYTIKKILNLTGIQKLSKEQQQEIKGSWGNEFCDYGYCQSNGFCIWA